MNLVKKITLTLSAAFIVASTTSIAIASQPSELEQSATQTQTSSSQIKEEQKLGYCWIAGIWVC